jgi:AhpD family alkylhydroperoxidase
MLWLTRRITGKDPLPARLLTHFPKGAVGAGVFELTAAGGADLDARCLAVARIVASVVAGCPFCVDMNAATWKRAGLRAEELPVLFGEGDFALLGAREAVTARYAKALSSTPVVLEAELIRQLHQHFTPRELVVLATTIAQVNFWTRFNQGLGVPAAGFFDESVCRLPALAAGPLSDAVQNPFGREGSRSR